MNELNSNESAFSDKEKDEICFKRKCKKFNIDSDDDDEDSIDYNTINNSSNSLELCPDQQLNNANQNLSNNSECTDYIDQQKSILSALCDSDNEEEEEENQYLSSDINLPIKQLNQSSPKLMTTKEANKLRQEIQSESQRMIREKNISLPYHKPKCHSLKIFLSKRQKFNAATTGTGKKLSVKMSKEQLEFFSQQLQKREEIVKEFYQSESESDESNELQDDDVNKTLETEQIDQDLRLEENAISNPKNSSILESEQMSKEQEKNINKTEKETTESHLDQDLRLEENTISNPKNLSFVESEQMSKEQEKNINKTVKETTESYQNESIKSIILNENLLNITPKLSGKENGVIELENNVLMTRLLKHAKKNTQLKQKKMNLNIISVKSNGNIQQELIDMNLIKPNDDEILLAKSVKLQNLKKTLEDEIIKIKSDIWQQKATEKNRLIDEMTINHDKNEEVVFDDEIIEEEEEEEGIDADDEEFDESYYKEKPRKYKSIFINEEAEESHDDDDDDKISKKEQNNETDKSNLVITNRKRTLLRIRPVVDDSDSDSDSDIRDTVNVSRKEQLDSTCSVKMNDDDDDDDDDDDLIPPHQPCFKSPTKAIISQSKSDIINLTPISFLANIESASSGTFSSTLINNGDLAVNNTSLSSTDPTSSQMNFDTQISDNNLINKTNNGLYENRDDDSQEPTTQELMDICSGNFSTIQSQQTDQSNEHSQILDVEQNLIISQLLDEEELKTVESRTINSNNHSVGVIIDSDSDSDDENSNNNKIKTKKRRQQQLRALSDDENSDESEAIIIQQQIDYTEYDSEENEVTDQLKDFFEDEAELSEAEEWHGSDDEDEQHMNEFEIELGDKEEFDDEAVRQDLEKIHMRRILDQDNREVKILQELYLEDGELHGTGRQRQFKWRNIDSTLDDIEKGNQIVENANGTEIDLQEEEEENEEHWRKARLQREIFLQERKFRKISSESNSSSSKLINIGRKLLITQNGMQKKKIIDDKDGSGGGGGGGREDVSNNNNKEMFEKSSDRKSNENTINKQFGSFLNRRDNVLERMAAGFSKSTTVDDQLDGGIVSKTSKNFVFKSTAFLASLSNNKRKLVNEETPKLLKKLRLKSNFLA